MNGNRSVPTVLWIGLVSLAVMVVLQLAMGLMGRESLLLAAVLGGILLVGLYHGHRWAYVVTVIIVFAKLLVGSSGTNPLVTLLIDCLVLVPVLMSSKYFWTRTSRDVTQ